MKEKCYNVTTPDGHVVRVRARKCPDKKTAKILGQLFQSVYNKLAKEQQVKFRVVITDPKSKADRPTMFFGSDLAVIKDELAERLKLHSDDATYEIYKSVDTLVERGNAKKTFSLPGQTK